MPPERDRRVDLLKGVALAMVVVDHFEDVCGATVLSLWTLRASGPSDAAELFVLLSGLVVGRTTTARRERAGPAATWRHAVAQTLKLYLAYALAAAMALLLLWGLDVNVGLLQNPGRRPGGVAAALIQAVTLQRIPYGLHILALYLVLLPFSPLIVCGLRRSSCMTLGIAAAIYAAVQWDVRGPGSSDGWIAGWYFRVGGWQLLYVLGLQSGVLWQRGTWQMTSPTRRAVGIAAAGVLMAGWWLRPDVTAAREGWLAEVPAGSRQMVMDFLDKRALGPLRLTHALVVAAACFLILPRRWADRVPQALQPAADCGAHSLLIYTTGVVLTVAGAAVVVRMGIEPWTVLFVEFDLLVVLGVLGTLRTSRRAQRTGLSRGTTAA